MTTRTLVAAAALVVAAAIASDARAQIRASEPASVSQTVDGTRITIEYSRPRIRGRKKIFGTDNVKWNETWTPGANYATTLETSSDITIDGHPVKKGKYSVWLVVKKSGPWTFVLNPKPHLFHVPHPDSAADQLRFQVKPEKNPNTEVLTWSFPAVSATGTTLALTWLNLRVAVDIVVQPSLVVELPEADAQPYLGRYTFEPITKEDSAKKKQDELVITYENGILKGQFDPNEPEFGKFALIRIGPDSFAPGIYQNGVIYEVMRPDLTVEFTRTGDRATKVEMRDDTDKLQGRATRP